MYRKSIKDKGPNTLGCDAAFHTFHRKKLPLSSRVKRQERNSRIIQCRTLNVVNECRIVEGSDLRPNLMFVFGATAPSGPGPFHSRGLYIIHNEAVLSVGTHWTSVQLVADTST
jgi:hypothetical protein